jgi:drug/metabolite transporter (DMT)-like permease
MHSLALGLVAALTWGLHDLCVRFAAQGSGILPAMLTNLATGSVLIGGLALYWGGWGGMTAEAAAMAVAAGAIYAVACYALYQAFLTGPVRLVAPIVGSYPVLSVAFAAAQGQPVPLLQWGAVFAVVAGVGCVAFFASSGAGARTRIWPAAGWGLLASCGWAGTFALGHLATQAGAELPALLVTRVTAVLAAALALLASRQGCRPPLRALPLLFLMGTLDALALGLVFYAGGLPRPEFAAVSSSLFGLVTVVLAWAILRERMTRAQWLSVAFAFTGIAFLGV